MPEELDQTTADNDAPSLESFNEPAPKATEEPKNTEPTAEKNTQDPKPADAANTQPAQPTQDANKNTEEDAYSALDSLEMEGVKVDADTLKSFKEIAKANNISIDAAKSIMTLQMNLAKKQNEDFKALQQSWENAAKVVYGDNLKNVETNCSRVLAELDKEGKFKELLALVGAEKHPATLGFLKAVGDKMLEKPAVNPNATVTGNEQEPELEDFN